MIVPLHNHSEYSALDGLSTMDEIAQRITEIGAGACGLTDHGVVAGHLEFAKTLQKADIKPVFGCELYHGTKREGFKGRERDQSHLVALAMNERGLRNLWALSNATAKESSFHNVGRVFWEDLEKYSEGLVLTSACSQGLVPQGLLRDDHDALNRYLEIFGDDFYIEIHTYPADEIFADRDDEPGAEPVTPRLINEALIDIAQERGIPLVYANDAHYAFAHQYPQHDLYIALQTRQGVYTPIEDRTIWHPPGALSIMDEIEVREALSYLPSTVVDEALDNSVALGERADAQLPEVRRHLPVFIPSECPFLEGDKTLLPADELFMQLVVEGIYERYGSDPSAEVWDRVEYEVETLINDNIHHYFLWGWDEIRYCDFEQIARGPGRGSSAGCIVAYALAITDVDPLHYGLIFERFWNSGRADGFPDIDSDFSQARRQEIIDYLRDRVGHDKVQAIGNVIRMKPKAMIERIASGCGLTHVEQEALKDIVGKTPDLEIHGHEQIGWSRDFEPGKVVYVEEAVGEAIDQWIHADPDRVKPRQHLVAMCEQLCSRIQQYGIHASGIVISDVPLADELPAYRRGGKKEGVPATQFPMDDVDKRYFIKLDVLGLRTLDTLEHWRLLMAERGMNVEWSGLDKQEHPPEIWDLLHEGFAAGVFQVESGYPKRLCEMMNARSVEDLAVIVALNRPGPMGDGVPDRYIARRSGDEPVSYPHPRLEELLAPHLGPTYGLFVYQEQVINYFNALNYTLSESDVVRKILGKKKPEALQALHDGLNEWEGRGYVEMSHAAGIPEKHAEDVWKGLERFASYSFNLSHAVAYGILGFRCAFAKYYGAPQFYASCMRTVDGPKRKVMLPLYINEARRLGFEVYPPDIERSQELATVDDADNILFGFSDVKDVGSSGRYMAKLRDQLNYDSPQLFYEEFEEINNAYLKQKKAHKKALLAGEDPGYIEAKSPKQKLGANKIEAIYKAGAWDSIIEPEIPLQERQQLEEELLGVILTDVSAEAFASNAEEIAGCDSYSEVRKPFLEKCEGYDVDPNAKGAGLRFTVPGVVTGVAEKRAKKTGKRFAIVTIEYERDQLEFTVFSSAWASHKFLFRMRTPGIFTVIHRPPNEYGENHHFSEGWVLRP